MNKLTILVLCALLGTAVPQRHHRHSSRSKGRHGSDNEAETASDANIKLSLGGLGGLTGGLTGGLGGFSSGSSQDANAALKLSLGGLNDRFGAMLGPDGKPSKSGSYKWSYSTKGGAADAGATLGGFPGGIQDPNAALQLMLGADGKPSKSGSYKWSYSTKGGAADAGRADANAHLNLGGLGGLANGIANGIGGVLGGAGAAINGGLGIVGGLEGAAAAIKGKVGGHSRHERRHGRRDSNAEVKLNLGNLGAGLNLGAINPLGSRNAAASAVSLTVNGVKFIQIGSKYYWIDAVKPMNWHAAQSTCRRNHAQLATIQSEEELKAINMFLSSQKLSSKNFWIAGNDLAEEGKFEWVSNGKPMTYAKWSPGQPDNHKKDENCVGLWIHNKEYMMNDFSCLSQLNVICEADTSCMYARK